MEYIHGLLTQGRMFLFSLGFGFLLGFLYDFFRFFRLLVNRSRGFTVFADIFYFLLSTLLTFFFLLVLDGGRVRLYSLGGELAGFLIYYFSFGVIAGAVFERISNAFKSIFAVILLPVKFLFTKNNKVVNNLCSFLKKFFNKFKKKQKLSCQTDT